ncbi:transmembrane protein 272-like, partial [Fundulus heteroclitus]|uniref:transmembrane protein 272-like n=1 Tax=Fundulus heteroclitus TaxID=8078 RepID=UPI00165A89CC
CIVTLFLFCWFIAGNVWVYSVYQPSYIKNATDVSSYCNKTLYLVAFSVITALNILLGLLLLLATCCALCIYCCISSFQTCFSNIIHADDDVPADDDISGDSAE